jgi:ankyrin repeat protein
LAHLHLYSLIGKNSVKAMNTALKNLATGSNAYNLAYTDAISRIESQNQDQVRLAKMVLSWITLARKPLRKQELQYALGVEHGEASLDVENLPDIEYLVSICAGLVTIDEQSSIIRLVHYTMQDYLKRTLKDWYPEAETEIARICITYLSFSAFRNGACNDKPMLLLRLRNHPLYYYSACCWGRHAKAASEIFDTTATFLSSEKKVQAAAQALCIGEAFTWNSWSGKDENYLFNVTGLHLAAYFDLEDQASVLIKIKPGMVNAKDSFGRSPLSWASAHGCEKVVRSLVEGGADIESKDNSQRTPLWWAMFTEGPENLCVTRYLLSSGASTETRDKEGRAALSWESERGHTATIRLLLNNGANINARDNLGRTPIFWAVYCRCEPAIELLLDKGADIDAEDYAGTTPLSWAVRDFKHATDTILQLIIERANINARDKDGRTPLSWAVYSTRNQTAIRLLLERGAEIESRDMFGRTPLSWAVTLVGNESTIEILLGNGADINTRSNNGRTPLGWARFYMVDSLENFLLTKGAV